jgi:hypothetical protein
MTETFDFDAMHRTVIGEFRPPEARPAARSRVNHWSSSTTSA